MKTRLQVSLLTSILCTMAACSSTPPPKEELLATETAIQAAIDSGAETEAPDDLLNAQQKFDSARHLIKKKKYDDAKTKLSQASIDAKLALRAAEASNARNEANLLSAEATRLKGEVSEREARLLEKQQELEAFKELQAKQTDRGMVLTLGDVLFNTNESSLNEGSEANMDRIAAFLRKYPKRTITIEGHTDNTGDDDYNHALSLNRASAVMSALQSRRIDSQRITVKGKGESYPLADNNSAAGRQQNRRVEVIFGNTETIMSDFDY